jgi:hypothetical protein
MLMDSITHGRFVLLGIGTFFHWNIIFDILGNLENVAHMVFIHHMSRVNGMKMRILSVTQIQSLQNLY